MRCYAVGCCHSCCVKVPPAPRRARDRTVLRLWTTLVGPATRQVRKPNRDDTAHCAVTAVQRSPSGSRSATSPATPWANSAPWRHPSSAVHRVAGGSERLGRNRFSGINPTARPTGRARWQLARGACGRRCASTYGRVTARDESYSRRAVPSKGCATDGSHSGRVVQRTGSTADGSYSGRVVQRTGRTADGSYSGRVVQRERGAQRERPPHRSAGVANPCRARRSRRLTHRRCRDDVCCVRPVRTRQSVRGLERGQHVGRQPATLRDLVAVCPGPLAHRRSLLAIRGGPGTT